MMQFTDLLPYLGWIIGGAFTLGAAGIVASVHTTRLKIKNGYPLEGMWGQSLKPGNTSQAQERVALLTQENAQLRAEMGAMKDRLWEIIPIMIGSVALVAIVLGIAQDTFQAWLKHKEKQMELMANKTAEQAAQYAAKAQKLEARVRVLERIATDRGSDLAMQIEDLRDGGELKESVQ